ncbi:venom serine protease-like [Periplaneta americana]|uniref:venom serine protease-like n=1 Tax=Periplaneta americana TaxID=6978 RepID=UPI0037E8A63C
MELRVWLMAGVALLASDAAAQCRYHYEVDAGQTYDIKSPCYPNSYPGGMNCFWQVTAPSRFDLILKCQEFYIQPSENCKDGKVLVSLTGDTRLSDGHKYCGSGTFTLKSKSNQMTMQLTTQYFSKGAFRCTITATRVQTHSPPKCDCGWKKQSRIVNGTETGVNEYPMMVGLVHLVNEDVFGGGTIIAKRYVLTAAHALLDRPVNITGVLVGDHDISTGDDTSSAKILLAESFQSHPDYNSDKQMNDIAVIRVDEDIIFSSEVGPACLPFRFPNINVGAVVTVLGWGTTQQGGPKSDVLLQTELYIIPLENCTNTFGSKVTSNHICTFNAGTDACQADSGGPVLWSGPGNRLHLLAVISYGRGCALGYPGVNTRVYPYINWILDVSPDAEYCIR